MNFVLISMLSVISLVFQTESLRVISSEGKYLDTWDVGVG